MSPTLQPAMTLGVAHFSAISQPPAEFAIFAARAGFKTIGLRLYPAFPGAPFYDIREGSVASRDLRLRLDGEGIRAFDIEFVVLNPEFDPASVEYVLASASAVGAQRLSVCGDDPDKSRLTTNFSELCQLARNYGMSVDMENMGWRTVRTFADSVAIVSASGADNANVLVDAIHFFRNGASAPELETFASKVKHIQLCDVRGPAPTNPDNMVAEARSGRFAPGDGELPLAALISAADPSITAISVEVPLVGTVSAGEHLRHLFVKTRRVLSRTDR